MNTDFCYSAVPPQHGHGCGQAPDWHPCKMPGMASDNPNSQNAANMAIWLKALVCQVEIRKLDWKPSCVIVDDSKAEMNAAR